MTIENTYTFAYSVKGTTRKLINEMGAIFPNTEYNELTKKSFEKEFNEKDLVIVGAPVYAGRIPKPLGAKLKSLKGNNTLAVAVVTYGNRAYEDALLELKNILEEQGFKVIAALVYVAQHSLAANIAKGRPNEKDLTIAKDYSKQILDKVNSLSSIDSLASLKVPGNFPYRKEAMAHKIEDFDSASVATRIENMILTNNFQDNKTPEIYI